ncbi:MAG: transglycosylase SLT domain-containing protein, partial [Rhizobiales bacterium]|nr:transglycosylase SLT domain-containing protein [Hyphomicrobiales bacterium]
MKSAFTLTSMLAAAMAFSSVSACAIAASAKADKDKAAHHATTKNAKDKQKASARKAGAAPSAKDKKGAKHATGKAEKHKDKAASKSKKAEDNKRSAHHSADRKDKASKAKTERAAHAAASEPARKLAAVPLPEPRPTRAARNDAVPMPAPVRTVQPVPPMVLASAGSVPLTNEETGALSYAPSSAPTSSDVEMVKEALALIRKGRISDATEREQSVRNPAARTLIEWVLLRSDRSDVDFNRYAEFLRAHSTWPSLTILRRRAETQLWQENRDAATVLAYFRSGKPVSVRGRLAFARALLAQGDRAGAQFYAREAWRNDDMSSDMESQALSLFGELLSRADHKARMDQRLYDEGTDDGLRAAERLGGSQVAIARARAAVITKSHSAPALLEAVPNEARGDLGYIFSRAQWLRRHDRIGEAAQLMLSAPNDPGHIHDPDEWWTERRIIVRKLLDADNPQAAYRVARDAAVPNKENYRIDQQFTAGWIALRFLNDPITAKRHFAQIGHGVRNPISLARGLYWQGRAAEASGSMGEAAGFYEAAARHPTAYYGQLARARLGRNDLVLRRPPALSNSQRLSLQNTALVRAVELLYAAGERDLVIPFVIDLADKAHDTGILVLLGEIAAHHNDARAMLLIGKTALGRGITFDQFAFPGIGVPKYASIGPPIDRSVVFAIARQESQFDPGALSSARALGLMQVMPSTGRQLAKKFGVAWNQKRMLHDPAYNAQLGAAELGDLASDYDGNLVLAFAAYNAGRGRVREWIGRFGDPRYPRVDPIDWVERIPFSETRNYVQRVMEN